MDEKEKKIVEFVKKFSYITVQPNSLNKFDALKKLMDDIFNLAMEYGFDKRIVDNFHSAFDESRVDLVESLDTYCSWLTNNVNDIIN